MQWEIYCKVLPKYKKSTNTALCEVFISVIKEGKAFT